MFRRSQNNVPDGPCFTCKIIRSFILASVMLLVLALIASDKMHYINFVTSEFIATIIITLGLIMFFIKLLIWLRERKLDNQ